MANGTYDTSAARAVADTESNLPHKRYVLFVLTLVYTLHFLDRGLVNLLLQPIKEDLQLSDTQLGFLTGIAFALFYATLGLPIARLADRGNRSTITAIAIGLWGITVMMCVIVVNFVQLALARVLAAIGESGCMPPTYSLLGDYFPKPAERTRAMAIYWMATPLASLISFSVGGWLNELYGWRMTFFLMGAPALIVAVLVKLTVREPRVDRHEEQKRGRKPPSTIQVLWIIWNQRAMRHLSLGIILLLTMAFGLSPWYAAFLMRSHGMGTAELGVWLGLIFGIGGMIGVLTGGQVCARLFSHDERTQMRVSGGMIVALIPCYLLFLLLPGRYGALAAMVPLVVVFNFILGPTFALMQRLVVDEMRATTFAVVMLFANLVGMGLGPQIVGILSDLLMPSLGVGSLRYAMIAVSFLALWAAYHFWQVGGTVKSDLRSVGC